MKKVLKQSLHKIQEFDNRFLALDSTYHYSAEFREIYHKIIRNNFLLFSFMNSRIKLKSPFYGSKANIYVSKRPFLRDLALHEELLKKHFKKNDFHNPIYVPKDVSLYEFLDNILENNEQDITQNPFKRDIIIDSSFFREDEEIKRFERFVSGIVASTFDFVIAFELH